jgi:hypothetical protein
VDTIGFTKGVCTIGANLTTEPVRAMEINPK